MLAALGWFGTATSLAGAALIATKKFAPGFVAFLIADAALSFVAYHARLDALLALYSAYAVLNVAGLWNNRPRASP